MTMDRTGLTATHLAGCLLVFSGSTILMGIITAEAVYPDAYTTHDNAISDLGLANHSQPQPASPVFNGAMLASGTATVASTYLLHRVFHTWSATVPLLLHGLGTLGVGLFPSDRPALHFLFAAITFISGGLAGLLATRVQSGPFRYLSALLGLIALGNLALMQFGRGTPPFRTLGLGGVERWVAYPIALWLVAFGAYLTGIRK